MENDKQIKFIHNLDQVVKVVISDKKKVNTLVYKPYKKGWFRVQEEGFKDTWGTFYTKEMLRTGAWEQTELIVAKDTAYYRPEARLYFSDESWAFKAYDTLQEAEDFVKNEILPKIKNPLITYR